MFFGMYAPGIGILVGSSASVEHAGTTVNAAANRTISTRRIMTVPLP
ncbi:Uncharacterised protein [Mycobacteroides abscessus subsp. abscessus]|nr:Uncharacterised protein [Mycobacteroides abscessus subsp. abscessus]